MKRLASMLGLISYLAILSACGGGTLPAAPPSLQPPSPATAPPPQGQTAATDNWEFTMTSTVLPGMPPMTMAGSLKQLGTSMNGAMHVNGWSCFDPQTTMGMTGFLRGQKAALTSAAVNGQVITFDLSKVHNALTGTDDLSGAYTINGGCATGDQGTVTGVNLTSMSGNWAGDLTTAGGSTIHMSVTMAQGGASPQGSFALSGTGGFSGGCFKSATIVSGAFPSGSYMMGRSIALEVDTDNGTISFVGTADPDGLIRGSYTVSGGTCTGNGKFFLSPWNY
jgi:hypothetical protein